MSCEPAFHVGCVGYPPETFAQFGDDLAVRRGRRSGSHGHARYLRDVIPRSTRGLPAAALQRRIRLGAVCSCIATCLLKKI